MLFVFIGIVVNAKSKHKKTITNGANCYNNKIEMTCLITDKIKCLVGMVLSSVP